MALRCWKGDHEILGVAYQRPHKTGGAGPDDNGFTRVKQGPGGVTIEGIEQPVCRAHYLELHAEVYPDYPLPDLPE